MRALLTAVAVAALVVSLARPAAADDEDRLATYAVQNRRFLLGHEINASIGLLPLDAFVKGLTFGGGYTYHFSNVWAWEVVEGAYSHGLDTGLKRKLIENFGVQPTSIDPVEYFATTSIVLKPLYGKFAWFNRRVVHAEIFLAVGAGAGKYQTSGFAGALDAGGGVRVHLGRRTSLRLDVRDYSFFAGLSPRSELHVALSFAVSAGGHAP